MNMTDDTVGGLRALASFLFFGIPSWKRIGFSSTSNLSRLPANLHFTYTHQWLAVVTSARKWDYMESQGAEIARISFKLSLERFPLNTIQFRASASIRT